MKSSDLIAQFERMFAEHWAYEWGAAREGCVDCSGAFVYAYKRFGQTIAHGSNTIARRYVVGGLRPVSEARPGWALFKRRDDNADMPAQYMGDGIGDIYHVGLCSRDGTRALNAKGTQSGFCSDPASAFHLCAPLKGVDYSDQTDESEEDEPMNVLYRAVVNTAKDDLRVREEPKTGKIIGHAPRGKVVDVLSEGTDGWPRIRYGELVGYASAAYLARLDELVTQPATPTEDGVETTVGGVVLPLADAQAIYEALGDAYRLLGAVLGKD